MRKFLICLTILASVFTSQGFAQQAAVNNLYLQTSEVHPIMVQFEADRGSLTRFYFVTNSPERRARMKQLYADYLKQLNNLNFDRMKQDGKVDYILFKRDLEEQNRLLDVEEKEYNQIAKYFGFSNQIYALE